LHIRKRAYLGKLDIKTTLANADSSSDLEWKINFGGEKDMEHERPDTLQFPSSMTDTSKKPE